MGVGQTNGPPPSAEHERTALVKLVAADALVHTHGSRIALDQFNFSLRQGVTALVGPNGAGKTTFLRLLATATRVQAGTLRVLELDPGNWRDVKQIRRRIGYLPQALTYPRRVSVREYLAYCAWLREIPVKQTTASVAECLVATDLEEWADRPLGSLSGGTLRRVGLAQSIIHRPRLLVLDEPTVGLDPEQRIRVRTLLRALAHERGVVVSSHFIEDVAFTCDQVVVIRDGRSVFCGSVQDLQAQARASAIGDSPLERGYSAIVGAQS